MLAGPDTILAGLGAILADHDGILACRQPFCLARTCSWLFRTSFWVACTPICTAGTLFCVTGKPFLLAIHHSRWPGRQILARCSRRYYARPQNDKAPEKTLRKTSDIELIRLFSQTDGLLYFVDVYRQVHTSIYIYIYIYECTCIYM